MEDNAKINKTPMSESTIELFNPKGIKDQDNKLKNKLNKGEKKYKPTLTSDGIKFSLRTNLNASDQGCSKPQKPTTFGPKRR